MVSSSQKILPLRLDIIKLNVMKKNLLAILRTLVFVLPLSLCFVSCEGFDLDEILGNIIKPGDEEEKEYQYFFEENFVDSLDAIYCDEGYIALFGFEEVEVAPGCSSEERVVYISKVENEKFMADDAMVIVVDSTNFPVRMATKDVNTVFSKVDESHFNCAVYTSQSGEWKEFENLSYESPMDKHASTRALATSGYSEFGLDDALTAISLTGSLKNGCSSALKNDQLGVLEANLGVFGDLQQGSDELGLGIGLATAGGLPGALLAVGGYLSGKYDDFVVKELGKVRLAIEDLKRHDGTTCEIFFSISGLNENGLKNSETGIIVSNVDAMFYTDFLKSANYEDSRVMKLPTGRYTVEVYIQSTRYRFIEYRVMYTFSMFKLSVDHYNIAPDADFSDGKVHFDVEVFLSGDSEELNKWIQNGVEFGYYIHYANAFDYKKVTNFSTIFTSTPLTYDLNIEREGFFEENIDYTSFKARTVDYHIGAYAVIDGNIQTYGEQDMELVYDEQPVVHTGEAVSVENTEATVECEFEDCLFWTTLRGVEYFSDSESEALVLDANEEDGTHGFHLTDLKSNTTYKYRAYYEVNGVKVYGETKSFKTKGSDLCDDANHVHAVDLGLSVKWACCNVGAESPEEYGGYYAWGETEPKSTYNWDTYKWCQGSSTTLTKYCTSGSFYGKVDNKTQLDLSDDAARANWGGSWRMPTLSEIQELCDKCSWQWTEVNGIKGQKVTGPNGNSIFLPAAGSRRDSEVLSRGTSGIYWSASLYRNYCWRAWILICWGSPGLGFDWDYGRSCGHTVRPVTE